MTKDDILAMRPGRELDALVMRIVFKAEKKDIGDECYWVSEVNGEEVCWPRWFSPSTDISAAMEVLDMFKGFEIVKHSYEVKVRVVRTGQMGIAYADSVPLAICRAALLAVMGE